MPDAVVVGFDKSRRDAGISHDDNQGSVIQAALSEAKIHLREKRDFVWNATNISRMNRDKVLGLFSDYGARIEIVHLEESEAEIRYRNRQRSDETRVPDEALDRILTRWEPPLPTEAHSMKVFESGIQTIELCNANKEDELEISIHP